MGADTENGPPVDLGRSVEKEEGEVTPQKESSGEPTTHPLEHEWALWFDNPAQRGKGGGGWGNSLRQIYSFRTVEDFWCLFNNIVPPSELVQKADMHLFKKGIEPKWEDPKCEKGGSWTVTCNKGKDHLDKLWMHTLLALIGEQFDEGEDICGAVVNIRPGKDRVAIWTKSASNEAIQVSIGKQLKSILDISDHDKIGFSSFADQKSGSRNVKDKYTV